MHSSSEESGWRLANQAMLLFWMAALTSRAVMAVGALSWDWHCMVVLDDFVKYYNHKQLTVN